MCDAGGRGYFTLKRVTGMSDSKDPPPFCTPSATPQDPISALFSSTRPHLNKKSQNFPTFCSKCLNFVNSQFLSLKIDQKMSLGSLTHAHLDQKSDLQEVLLSKNQFSKPQIWHRSILQAPIFGPSSRTPLPLRGAM